MLWQNTSMTQSEEILEQGLINIVLHEGDKCLMVLRPYQFYAVEQILDRVQNTNKNVYIWHTTGAGKTLTSFKAAQLVSEIDGIGKAKECGRHAQRPHSFLVFHPFTFPSGSRQCHDRCQKYFSHICYVSFVDYSMTIFLPPTM